MFASIELFGINFPFWAIFLIGIIAIIIIWKLVKFALKLLLILVIFFIILIGLDYFDVFGWIENLFSGIISY